MCIRNFYGSNSKNFRKLYRSAKITDDILVYGNTPEEHDKNLYEVLKTIDQSGITLNSEKCKIGLTDIIFFCLRLTSKGIAPTDDRCRALREIEPPSNPKELRSLLGLIQYGGRFLHNLHTLAERKYRTIAWLTSTHS